MSDVCFVGCGPGDPELLTLKAKRLIQDADVVVYSGSLIPKPILELCNGQMHDAAKLVREEIFGILYDGAKKGKRVIRLHDGDPSIYGAIKEQIDSLAEKGINSTVVPGVTAFLASAAALNTQLTLPGITQTIIITRVESRTDVPDREKISGLAKHKATLIFYLSVHLVSEIVSQSIAGGYDKDTPVAVVYRASWDDQKIIKGTLGNIREKLRESKITRTAIVIISNVIDSTTYEYSRLYDKEFSHGFRKSK